MNSRERVITALRHEEPDRVPIDLGGTAVSSIAMSTYAALRGGFVFNPVHNIQPNVPPENIVALFEAARESGRYPVGA